MRADEILGKTVLVGLTYVEADGRVRERRQVHGVVVSANEDEGIEIRQPSGEIFTLPPAFESFEPAEPGEYTLRSGGEAILDPDLLCSWTITSPSETPATVVGWVDRYREQHDLYEAFAERLRDLLRALINDRELDYDWIIAFDIDADDLWRDLLLAWREGDPLTDPLNRRLRVIGLTVCVHSPRDLQELEELLVAEFVVDMAGSTTWTEAMTSNARSSDQADDAAISYVLPSYLVELDERRAVLPEWSPYAGLKVRIDGTTGLHDAWRDVRGHLPLRHAGSYPQEVRDILARLAASIEAADTELELVRDSVDRLLEECRVSVAAGDLDLPLNAITVAGYLQASDLVQSIVELAVELDFNHDPDDWPSWEEIEDGTLWLLRRDGVGTLAELDALLRNALPRTRETLRRFLEVSTDQGFAPWAVRDDLVEWLWLVFRRADGETVALMYYRDEIARALDTVIGNPVATREQDA